MKMKMVAMALAAVMVLAAFVPIMGMIANDDQNVSAGNEYTFVLDESGLVLSKIPISVLWSDGTLWNQQTKDKVGIYNTYIIPPGSTEPISSYCTDIMSMLFGAKYAVDEADRGLADADIQYLMAALDYINDKYGGFTWGNNAFDPVEAFSKAIAQICVWYIIYDGVIDEIRGLTGLTYSWDFFEDAVQDVLDNCEAAYADKLANAPENTVYVSGIVFLNDVNGAAQSQMYPVFDQIKRPTGILIVGKDMGKKVSYGSVTGGYDEEAVPDAKGKYDHSKYIHNLDTKLGKKGNWFQYNEFTGTSATFDLVTGNNLKKVGEYDISYANGLWTVTIRGNDALVPSGSKISISNIFAPNIKNANDLKKFKDVAKNPIWTSSPGQQQFAFGGDTFTFAAPWIDMSKTIYVYIHMSLSGYEGTSGAPLGTAFDVLVTGPSFPAGTLISVPMNGSVKLTGLLPGTYKVQEIAPGWKATYYSGSAVTTEYIEVGVQNAKTVTVNMKNEPVPDPKGWFAVQKMVEQHDGSFEVGEGYEFEAFEEVDDDTGILSGSIGTATTGADGIAVFGPSKDIIVGKTYYIAEVMSPDQEYYLYGGSAYVEAVAVEEGATFEPVVFENYQIHAMMFFSMSFQAVEQIKVSGGTVAGGDLESDRIVQGAWQRAKMIDVNAILAGEDFTANLVVGFNLSKVGTYTITADGDGGLWVILNYYPGIRANTETMVAFGNANNDKTQSDISGSNSNNGSGLYKGAVGGSIHILPADVIKLNKGGLQYFYLHSGTAGGTAEVDVSYKYGGVDFYFEEEDGDGCACGCYYFCLNAADGYEYSFECLPDQYTLHCLTGGWTYTCCLNGGAWVAAEGFECDVEPGDEIHIDILAKKVVSVTNV